MDDLRSVCCLNASTPSSELVLTPRIASNQRVLLFMGIKFSFVIKTVVF